MKIFYWAPWIGNIGTIKAVLNSAFIMGHYSKNKIQTKIINSVGEWDNQESLVNALPAMIGFLDSV